MSADGATRHGRESKSTEYLVASRLTHLRLELALAMQTLRASAGLTQKDLADRLGVNQPAVAKLERVGDHKIESVARYLGELGAELLVAVRQGDDVVQVSEDRERLVVALPREVDDWAAATGMDLDEFVMEALRRARAPTAVERLQRASVASFSAGEVSELVGAEIEMYDDERIAAFLAEDALMPELGRRLPTGRLPTHPGELLLEEFLKPLGISQVEFAQRLGVSCSRLGGVIRGRRGVTPDTALRLERVTGASAAFWLGLQQDWNLWHAERGDAARAIAELAPLAVAKGREAVVDPYA